VITGGGKWVEITTDADPLYQHLILTAERKVWRCVESGEPPRLFGVEPPKLRIQAARIVDMSDSNAWAEFAAIFAPTRAAYLEHEQAKTELKGLMPAARRRSAEADAETGRRCVPWPERRRSPQRCRTSKRILQQRPLRVSSALRYRVAGFFSRFFVVENENSA
jgi:hypothetical protein